MKKLKEILFKVNIDSVFGDTNINVSKITFDSREVKDQALFIAIKGHKFDGHNYINQAIENEPSNHLYQGERQRLKFLIETLS